MNEDMSDTDLLLWIELRFGLTKSIVGNPSNDDIQAMESQLNNHLLKYKEQLKITIPVPRIRMWMSSHNKVNFLFFDKRTGKRILLGDWLSNREGYYEH